MAIGDTAAGLLAAALTAAVVTAAALSVAPTARTAVVACAVCAAIGVVAAGAMSVCTELAGCAGSELLTTDAGDAERADEPVCAVREEPRWAATPTSEWAASGGMNGGVGAEVAISGPAPALCPPVEFSVPVGGKTGVRVAGPPVSVAFAFAPPELVTDDDGPD